jgi:hypothetical protein
VVRSYEHPAAPRAVRRRRLRCLRAPSRGGARRSCSPPWTASARIRAAATPPAACTSRDTCAVGERGQGSVAVWAAAVASRRVAGTRRAYRRERRRQQRNARSPSSRGLAQTCLFRRRLFDEHRRGRLRCALLIEKCEELGPELSLLEESGALRGIRVGTQARCARKRLLCVRRCVAHG